MDFECREGEFLCLLGPSGCGKTTLLNVIGGFLKPTTGQVLIDGEPVTRPDPRRIFVFQERGVFPWLTVEENIGFGLTDLPAPERRRRIAHYLELVGLTGFARAGPRSCLAG
ncbi:ATP-binding cassette domain-containing protein [Cystobacter fuscus]